MRTIAPEVASYSTTERDFVIYTNLVVDMSVVTIDDTAADRFFARSLHQSTTPRL